MRRLMVLTMCVGVVLVGCAALKKAVKVRKPEVAVKGMRVDGLSFSAVDLVFDIEVDNPNPLPVTLARYGYDLRVEGNSFLKGEQVEPVDIGGLGVSVVPLPLRLDFGDLRRTYAVLAEEDSVAYELVCELVFDLPVLGEKRLPLKHGGKVPVVRPPGVEVGDLKVNRLNLTGADLVLELKLENSNPFAVALKELNYDFAVGEKSWAKGTSERPVELEAKGEGVIALPVSVSFLNLGRSAYRALTKKAPLEYRLSGALDLGTGLPLLPAARIPLEKTGSVKVRR